ncbi:MAG: SDR family NAD(P)-dependent oxidoreductase, partial [Pseudomonadota bacterium]
MSPVGQDLGGRIVLVTGAGRGLGRAVALAAGAAGAHLVLVARTQGALEELDDLLRGQGCEAPTLAPLDITDGAAVDGLGAAIMERFGRLDGWVHTAAELGILTPVSHLKPEVLARVSALSIAATHRLIRSLDLPLRQSGGARVVVATCRAGRPARPYWAAFAAPRAAMEALALAYAAENANAGLCLNLFDPGPLRTRLRAEAYPG